MVPTFGERLGMVAAEVKAAVLRTHEVPVAKFGLSSNASPGRNAKALDGAIASVDPGTIIRFGSRVYPIEQGVVRGMRGSIELRGDSVRGDDRTMLAYTSTQDGTIGVGNCITFGIDKPELVPAGATGLFRDVTVRGLSFRDLNRQPVSAGGHNPSALEIIFVENPLVDACGLWNVKGNSGVNILGWNRNNTTPVTRKITVQNCWGGGDPLGGYLEGDLVNAAGAYELAVTGNRTSGGIRRHFLELGTGVHVLTVEDNVGDLKGQGLSHLASIMAAERASVRRNVFSNWGAGSSAITVAPDAPAWSQGDVLPIIGLECEDNTFRATPDIWSAALAVLAGDLRDHAYRRNAFTCPLAFYLAQQPSGLFEISGSDFTPNLPGRAFIALHQALASPSGPATIGTLTSPNVLRKGATLFDRGTWETHPLVSVHTNHLAA